MESLSPSTARSMRSRRTRFVCIADTHNRPVKLPKGDVLIHAGDLTNQGSYSELAKAVYWLENTDFEAKIVIAGNHDITLDRDFYARRGSSLHSQSIQDPEECISLLTSSPTVTYLCHSQATIRLTKPDGPRTTFTVFGSPYSPRVGRWAFDYARSDLASGSSSPGPHPLAPDTEHPAVGIQSQPLPGPTAAELWSSIPLATDILVTHTPPHLHCDRSTTHDLNLGCEDLRRALWHIRPRLHVCGHVHEARGAERVRWDIRGEGREPYTEVGAEPWVDPCPDGGKISLVDLTGRGGRAPLDNDGSHPATAPQLGPGSQTGDPTQRGLGSFGESSASGRPANCGDADPEGGALLTGQAGDPESMARCDRASLLGRTGRRETCVVNCAIAATSWPHAGGRRFHKPVVVDLDLPVCEGQD